MKGKFNLAKQLCEVYGAQSLHGMPAAIAAEEVDVSLLQWCQRTKSLRPHRPATR